LVEFAGDERTVERNKEKEKSIGVIWSGTGDFGPENLGLLFYLD